MSRGGYRPSNPGGRPKGRKNDSTIQRALEKSIEREELRNQIKPYVAQMLRAQIQHSQGISHLMLRQKDGTFKRSDNVDEIEQALNSGDENAYYIFTKDPSIQAFTDLMNRFLDKPKEQEQEVAVKGTLKIQWAAE